MEAVLRTGAWGALGLCSEGKPYVVPLNYAYADGKILFHCALEGMKLDMIRANPQVCFTVARQTGTPSEHPAGKPCEVDSDSVICCGTARIVEDLAERALILNTFNRAFRPDAEDLSMERVRRCGAVEITVTEMTGRRERDGKRTFWRHA
jgi:nitroimidazol reductase NimA-like FMN-containing flavoprotein (pyridoxamine 5'-phosphate oxidase superfamily)